MKKGGEATFYYFNHFLKLRTGEGTPSPLLESKGLGGNFFSEKGRLSRVGEGVGELSGYKGRPIKEDVPIS